ncbi:MAG: rRNA maturation RNAse YbeY [Candidatus Aegiribacteria sp.]
MAEITLLLENIEMDRKMLEDRVGELIDDRVEIVVADPGYMRVLNSRYRHIDRPTDVISFDLALREEDRPEGTIFVDGRLFPPMEELLERIFHGYLHLSGYSHDTDEDREDMSRMVDEMVSRAMKERGGT